VTFEVIPLFAAANVGIHFSTLNIWHMMVPPVTLGVIAGLVAGKFIDIAGMSWLAVKAGVAQLPNANKEVVIHGYAGTERFQEIARGKGLVRVDLYADPPDGCRDTAGPDPVEKCPCRG